MEKFVFLDDEATADVAFIANGKTKAEIIANACLALTNVMTDADLISHTIYFEKEFNAEDLLGLIYDLLNYLLFLFDTQDLFFNDYKIDLNEEKVSLVLKASGEKYDENKHIIKGHIKAVTFFGMVFDENGLKVTLDL